MLEYQLVLRLRLFVSSFVSVILWWSLILAFILNLSLHWSLCALWFSHFVRLSKPSMLISSILWLILEAEEYVWKSVGGFKDLAPSLPFHVACFISSSIYPPQLGRLNDVLSGVSPPTFLQNLPVDKKTSTRMEELRRLTKSGTRLWIIKELKFENPGANINPRYTMSELIRYFEVKHTHWKANIRCHDNDKWDLSAACNLEDHLIKVIEVRFLYESIKKIL